MTYELYGQCSGRYSLHNEIPKSRRAPLLHIKAGRDEIAQCSPDWRESVQKSSSGFFLNRIPWDLYLQTLLHENADSTPTLGTAGKLLLTTEWNALL